MDASIGYAKVFRSSVALTLVGALLCLYGCLLSSTAHGQANMRGTETFAERFSLGGERLLVANGSPRVWDIRTRVEIQRFTGHQDRVVAAALSPDGRYALTAGGRRGDQALSSKDNTARLWEIATGREVRAFVGHAAYIHTIHTVLFSPDGHRILTMSGDATARLWELETGSVDLEISNVAVVPMVTPPGAFDRDGSRVLAISSRGTRLAVWDVGTSTETHVLSIGTVSFQSAEWSPDGKTILTASNALLSDTFHSKFSWLASRSGSGSFGESISS